MSKKESKTGISFSEAIALKLALNTSEKKQTCLPHWHVPKLDPCRQSLPPMETLNAQICEFSFHLLLLEDPHTD